MHRSRLFTVAGFAGVLAFRTAAVTQCGPGGSVTTTTTTTLPRIGPTIEMESVTPTGSAATYPSGDAVGSVGVAMTPDGRYVVFDSVGLNIVSGDTNGMMDVFVRDRVAGMTERVDLKGDGSQITSADFPRGTFNADQAVYGQSISADGRYVVFATQARLVASDTDNYWDLYRFDRQTGSLDLVTVPGVTGPGLVGSTSLSYATISADGRYVAFVSDSQTLVAGDADPNTGVGYPNDQWPDVFVRDMVAGTTMLVSAGPGGSAAAGFGAHMTRDGRYIAFAAIGMVSSFPDGEIMRYDRTTGTSELVGLDASGQPALGSWPAISADGNVVVFSHADQNAAPLTPDAQPTSDGFDFHRYARNISAGTTVLVDANVPLLTTDREPMTAGTSLSADGRYVSFACYCQRIASGPNAGNGHDGVYRADLTTGTVIEVDENIYGVAANSDSAAGPITADGSSILFTTSASNLVTNDFDGLNDVFLSTPQ